MVSAGVTRALMSMSPTPTTATRRARALLPGPHGEVLWQAPGVGSGGAHGADGGQVVVGEDPVEVGLQLQQLSERGLAAGHGRLGAHELAAGVVGLRDAGVEAALAVAARRR